MAVSALIGALVFVVACAIVGFRLLFIAWRTRELPELLMGTGFVTGAVIAYGAGLIRDLTNPSGAVLTILSLIGGLGGATASVAVPLSVWAIFYVQRRWVAFCVGVLVTLHLPMIYPPLFGLPPADVPEQVSFTLYWGWSLARIAGYLWMSWKCLSQHNKLRRRLRLGMPLDPLLGMRILLWGVAHSLVALMFSAWIVNSVIQFNGHPGLAPQYIVSAFGTPTALVIWFAFFPPKAMRRRLREAA